MSTGASGFSEGPVGLRKSWVVGLLIGLLLSSCLSGGGGPPTFTPPATFSPPPALPSPTSIPGVVLLSPAEALSPGLERAERAVQVLADSRGWRVTTASGAPQTLTAAVAQHPALIVSLATGLGAAMMQSAGSNSSLRFVAIEEPEAQPSQNLLVVGSSAREDEEGFLAGALAGVENANHRVGWVGELGSLRGKLYENGFLHGVRYTCPLCLVYPYDLPPDSPPEAGLPAADSLRAHYVDTASAIPGPAGDRALLELSSGLVRVSSPDPGLWGRVFAGGKGSGASNVLGWARTRPDVLLQKALPGFLGGKSAGVSLAYSLEDEGLDLETSPNPWISPGLQANLSDMVARLQSGELEIGINPQTGDPE